MASYLPSSSVPSPLGGMETILQDWTRQAKICSEPTGWDGDNRSRIIGLPANPDGSEPTGWDGDLVRAEVYFEHTRGSEPTGWDGDEGIGISLGFSCEGLFRAHWVGWRLKEVSSHAYHSQHWFRAHWVGWRPSLIKSSSLSLILFRAHWVGWRLLWWLLICPLLPFRAHWVGWRHY